MDDAVGPVRHAVGPVLALFQRHGGLQGAGAVVVIVRLQPDGLPEGLVGGAELLHPHQDQPLDIMPFVVPAFGPSQLHQRAFIPVLAEQAAGGGLRFRRRHPAVHRGLHGQGALEGLLVCQVQPLLQQLQRLAQAVRQPQGAVQRPLLGQVTQKRRQPQFRRGRDQCHPPGGQQVLVGKYTGSKVKLEDVEYTIVRQNDILAVIE